MIRKCLDCPKTLPEQTGSGKPRLRCSECARKRHKKQIYLWKKHHYVPSGNRGRPRDEKRRKRALDLRSKGKTFREIGKAMKISAQAAYYFCRINVDKNAG